MVKSSRGCSNFINYVLQIAGAIFGSLLAAALVPEAHIGEPRYAMLNITYLQSGCDILNRCAAGA
jgi:hypothetical protein